jgi:cytochrome P450
LLHILFSAGGKWKNRRRIITPAFHDKELLNNFVDIYNEQSTILIQRLASIKSEKEINLYPYIASCALDIICGSLFFNRLTFIIRII